METLQDVFLHTLRDLYFAEHALTKALPGIIGAVDDADLQAVLEKHLGETRTHVTTLDRVFASIGQSAEATTCDAMNGLIAECERFLTQTTARRAREISIVACCQAIEHYEIARYGTVREWASLLGHVEAHDLLAGILDQEKAANHALSHLAVTSINEGPPTSTRREAPAADEEAALPGLGV
jgi:ferritin-like metal-binding protein YciE